MSFFPLRRRSTLRTSMVAVTLLVASGSYAKGQFGPSDSRKAAAPSPPTPQSAPVSKGITDVKWDGNTIRFANDRPMMIYGGTDPIQPTSRILAAISGNRVLVMPGIDVDPVKLQKSLDDYESMLSRGGGAPVSQTLNTLGPSESMTSTANGADKLTWVGGEPRVHLADGSEVTFGGSNGSKIEVISSGNTQTTKLQFTEPAHSPYGVAKGLAKAMGTGLTTGSQTAALEGGAWKAQIVGGRSFNQDNGTNDMKAFVPLWVKQVVRSILRSQQVVLADAAGHQYAFAGTKKLREVLGEPPP
jgi:hypothetical protein